MNDLRSSTPVPHGPSWVLWRLAIFVHRRHPHRVTWWLVWRTGDLAHRRRHAKRLALNLALAVWDVLTAFDRQHRRHDFGRWRDV